MPQVAVIDRWESPRQLGVAVVGAGHWGGNCAGNVAGAEACALHWARDVRSERAGALAASPTDAQAAASLDVSPERVLEAASRSAWRDGSFVPVARESRLR